MRHLVLVPGIFGSQLWFSGVHPALNSRFEICLWNGNVRSFMSTFKQHDILYSDFDSVEARGDVASSGQLRTAGYFNPLLGCLRQSTEMSGGPDYRLGENLHVFHYDWRQSNLESAVELARFLQGLVGRVSVVGYSMGGIVSRLALSSAIGSTVVDSVDNLVVVGSPLRGSTKSVDALKRFPVLGPFDSISRVARLFLGETAFQRLRQAMRGWPSVYELFPHSDEETFQDHQGLSLPAQSPDAWQDPRTAPHLAQALEVQELLRSSDFPRTKHVLGTRFPTPNRLLIDSNRRVISEGKCTAKGDSKVTIASASDGLSVERLEIDGPYVHRKLLLADETVQAVVKAVGL